MRFLFLLICIFPFIAFSQRTEFSSEKLMKHIEILASDSLEGRKPGTPGDIKAADYIRKQFIESKLRLSGINGFQKFDLVTEVKCGKNNQLKFNDTIYELNQDFTPYSFSSSSQLKSEICFAGYGFNINEDTVKWNDYENIDTKGKWVLILAGDPEPENANSVFIPYCSDRQKVIIAKDHGAAGVIIVEGKKQNEKDEIQKMSYDKTAGDAGIPVISMTRKLADKILMSSDKKIIDLENKLGADKKPQSFNAKESIEVQTDVIQVISHTQNIIAIKFGTDEILKDEYIVIGAHYDHLGYGGENSGSRMPDTSAIHFGADDNASGVSAVIELAYRFASVPTKRSLIFVAFAGEEMGLLGSKYFVENKPIENGYFHSMINFDMIGRMKTIDPYLSVSGTGTATEFDSLLDFYAAGRNFKIQKTPDGYGPSDHANFYSQNIPVLFITSGAHQDYHTPFDTKDKVETDKILDITMFGFDLIAGIANAEFPLHFKQAGSTQPNKHGRKLKVTLGIIPDVASSDVKGLRVSGVRKGGPAEAGGLKTGDVIIAMNGLEVTNIYDYMQRLSMLKNGETVIVEVIRENKKEILLIQL